MNPCFPDFVIASPAKPGVAIQLDYFVSRRGGILAMTGEKIP